MRMMPATRNRRIGRLGPGPGNAAGEQAEDHGAQRGDEAQGEKPPA